MCVAVLDSHPEVVLCYTKGVAIDEEGVELRYFTYTIHVDWPSPSERARDLMMMEHPVFTLFGLVRADILRRTPLLEHYPGSDRILTVRYGLLGPIYRIPEYLHYRTANIPAHR